MADTGTKDPAVQEIILGYVYMLIWIVLSALVILFNKFILTQLNFSYPITLTMIHMGFGSVLSTILVKSGFVKGVQMPFQTYLRCVVPISGLFALTLWFGNAAYLSLSVSFIQMLKASMPVAVYVVGQFLGTEKYSLTKSLNMLVITAGVAIASYGEYYFVWKGFTYQMASIASESTRLTLIQILLQKQGIKLNPVTTLYYIAPTCFVFLAFPQYLLEVVDPTSSVIPALATVSKVVLLSNAVCAFMLNMAVFLLIGKTSALTMNIAGVIKDWMLIGLSYLLFRAPVTALNLFGYFISFLGVAWFNYKKIKAVSDAAKSSSIPSQPDKEKQSLLTNGK